MKALLLLSLLSSELAGGFAEIRAEGYLGVDGKVVQLVERFRPDLTADLHERVVFSATVEAAFQQGRSNTKAARRALKEAGVNLPFPKEKNRFLEISDADDYLSVERLYLDFYLPGVDLRLGRQALHWGSALMLNPTDPFPEVLFSEPWKLRRGVNALRATIPIGETHQIKAVVGANDALNKVRAAARGTMTLGETDFSLVGAYRQETEDGLVGIDIRGTLGVGFWLEGAWHLDQDGEGYEELAVGIDYSFAVLESLIVAAQYYRYGSGEEEAGVGALVDQMASGGSEPNAFSPAFRGRDYGLLSLSLGIDPEISASAIWLQNLGDGSGVVVPSFNWAILDWAEVALSAQLPFLLWGDSGELRPDKEELLLPVPAGEPGGQPVMVDYGGLVPTAVVTLWLRASF